MKLRTTEKAAILVAAKNTPTVVYNETKIVSIRKEK
jgi:hypothetical protein